jgi:hypothetical protein
VTTLPASPSDGQVVIWTNSLSAPAYSWTMQWLASASCWLCTGGTGWLEGTTAVTVPRAGDYYCEIGGQALAVGAGGNSLCDIAVTAGGITLGAYAGQGSGQNNSDYSSCFDKGKMVGLTASQVLTTTSGTRPTRGYIRVQPVRVT